MELLCDHCVSIDAVASSSTMIGENVVENLEFSCTVTCSKYNSHHDMIELDRKQMID